MIIKHIRPFRHSRTSEDLMLCGIKSNVFECLGQPIYREAKWREFFRECANCLRVWDSYNGSFDAMMTVEEQEERVRQK